MRRRDSQKTMRYVFSLILSIFLLSWQVAYGVEVSHLYRVEVDEQGQSSTQAKQQAFDQLMLRLTGQPEILQQSSIQTARKNVDHYLLGLSRRSQSGHSYFVSSFDENLIRPLITQAGFGIWGKLRPRIALWIAMRGDEPQILSDSTSGPWSVLLNQQAQKMAIPVVLPLMDLDDLQQVEFSDVWGLFIDSVGSASARYGADYVLLARLSQKNGAWLLDYALYSKGDPQFKIAFQGEIQDADSSLIMQKLMLQLSRYFATDFGVKSSGDMTTLGLTVDHLASMEQVERAKRLLQGLPSVSTVRVQQISGDRIGFTLFLSGTRSALEQALTLDRRFVAKPFAGDDGLHYNWQP